MMYRGTFSSIWMGEGIPSMFMSILEFTLQFSPLRWWGLLCAYRKYCKIFRRMLCALTLAKERKCFHQVLGWYNKGRHSIAAPE